jgi:predicted phosphate transport protein (TIGR00153 family)
LLAAKNADIVEAYVRDSATETLKMAFSFLPKETQYFALFSQMASKIGEAADILVEMLNAPDAEFESFAKRIKSVEHECDELAHSVSTKLNSSFITPFDREDIYTLAMALDDVCDYIDASARTVVIYDIHGNDQYAQQLAAVLKKQAVEIHGAVSFLEKAKGMEQHLLDIQRLENDADEIYFNAMAALFKNSNDAINVIKMKELYEMLENATDKCEYVGNIIESIVLKHN